MTCHAKPHDYEHVMRPTAVWRSRKEPRGVVWYAYCEECASGLPVLPVFEDKRAAWEIALATGAPEKDAQYYYNVRDLKGVSHGGEWRHPNSIPRRK